MPKMDAVADLARQLTDALRAAREQGAYPLTVASLAGRLMSSPSPDDVERALAKKPFADGFVRARKKDAASPIALAEDAGRLAESDLLLEYALRRLCSAEKPLHPVTKVVSQVDVPLRPTVTTALERRLAEGRLPAPAGKQTVKGKAHLYLRDFPPPPPPRHPAEELGEQLLRALEARRAGDYPAALAGLIPDTKSALLKQALGRGPLKNGVVLGAPGRPDAPAVLIADRDTLAESPALLTYLLRTATTARRPLASAAKLAELASEALRPRLTASLARRLDTGDLPPGVGMLPGKDGAQWFLTELLPAPAALAWRLLRALEARRAGGAYPVTLHELAREMAATADDAVHALGEKSLKTQFLAALPGSPRTPVALSEDAALLARWPPLIEAALAAARSPDNQALAPAELKKPVATPLRARFAEALQQRLSEGSLPTGVGVLRVKRKPLLFLLADLHAAPPPAPVPTAPPEAIDFATRFDEVFARLDRARGDHNLVSLVELRREVGLDRALFDAGLRELRRQGRYGLGAAEGRHGISPEERQAGIIEDGSLLLFVSRKST